MPYQIKARAVLLTYYLPDMTLPVLIDKLAKQLDGKFWTINKEQCPTTGTFHYHLYVHASNQMDHEITYWNVDNVQPDCNPNTTSGSGFMTACCRGHFYVECRYKIDHITQLSNFPWEHYPVPVKPAWIITLWKQHKIDSAVVSDCLHFYRTATKHWLDIVNIALQYERTKSRDEYHANRKRVLEQTHTPYNDYPIISDWKSQYSLILPRYKFLVVSGPSNLGKTGLIMSHFPNAFVHSDSINWIGYDHTIHSAIIFDDIRDWYDYVITHKVLFQASARQITVHSSPTNCNALKIDVAGKPFIILTNQPLAQTASSDVSYINSNSFSLDIDSQTFATL